MFLVAQLQPGRLPRRREAVVVALLGAGIALTAVPGRGSLVGLGLCLAGALVPGALAAWARTRFDSAVHRLWFLSAVAAVLLARARDHQGRRTTLLFGSPSDLSLVLGGAALCLLLRALERKVRARAGERASSLMLPVVFLAVMEGGDVSIAIGNGFFTAWMLWDAALGCWERRDGHVLRALGGLAQGALLALYLVPGRYLGGCAQLPRRRRSARSPRCSRSGYWARE